MSITPRIPSPESIRQSMDDLRSGKLSAVDHETREEILNLAQMRIEAVLPDEIRAQLAQYSPQVVEAYGLLLRWQAERGQYPPPREEGIDQEEVPVAPAPTSPPITSQQNTSQPPSGGFQVNVQPGQDPLSALYQAAAGPLIAMHQLSQATLQPTVSFQAGPKMPWTHFKERIKGL